MQLVLYCDIFCGLGYGVFVLRNVQAGEFLLQYPGEVLSAEDGVKREEQYKNEQLGCYLYFFDFNGKKLWSVKFIL